MGILENRAVPKLEFLEMIRALVLVFGIVAALLGGLWLLQGLGVVQMRPVLCFVGCAPVQGPSPAWAVTGTLALLAAVVCLFWFRKTRAMKPSPTAAKIADQGKIIKSNPFPVLRGFAREPINRDRGHVTGRGPVWPFFGLVVLLSVPFYVLGISRAALPFASSLPLSALMAVVPVCAAFTMIFWHGGMKGAQAFVTRSLGSRTFGIGWAILSIIFMPVAFAVTGGLIWLSNPGLPTLHPQQTTVLIPVFALFFVGAIGEELGWQGYAFPALTTRYSALGAALLIGLFWAAWHVIPFVLMGRSADWIMWHGASMVLMRVIIVWLAVNAGNGVKVAVLFHMMSNSVWGIFPNYTPYYDPAIMDLVLLAPVAAVVYLWGPTTLMRFRFG